MSIDKSNSDIFTVTHHHVRDLQHTLMCGRRMVVSENTDLLEFFQLGLFHHFEFSSHLIIRARYTKRFTHHDKFILTRGDFYSKEKFEFS